MGIQKTDISMVGILTRGKNHHNYSNCTGHRPGRYYFVFLACHPSLDNGLFGVNNRWCGYDWGLVIFLWGAASHYLWLHRNCMLDYAKEEEGLKVYPGLIRVKKLEEMEIQ